MFFSQPNAVEVIVWDLFVMSHESDVTWTSLRLKSSETRLFVQSNIGKIVKSSHYGPFVRRIHRWPMVPLTKGSVKRFYVLTSLYGRVREPCLSWWRHQMETFSALLAICAGNSPVNGEFRAQRPVTQSFDVFFDLRMNKRLSKQSWGWWFETL